jgi:hypothetical protein
MRVHIDAIGRAGEETTDVTDALLVTSAAKHVGEGNRNA